ncbi:MAG TPA: DNA-directed RNA polymerase subunit omega [Candidatus Omnitrophota bacterium]|jgi:DNA-directed RNA polymerase omega subunit|nr:DNA-directed RNA polymerase subunit omega [Candidatus Omnitrophota bacterium]
MGYVDREKLLDKSEGSVYKLVNLAAKRALEVAEGQPKLVDVNAALKPSTIALYEISAGKVESKRLKGKG